MKFTILLLIPLLLMGFRTGGYRTSRGVFTSIDADSIDVDKADITNLHNVEYITNHPEKSQWLNVLPVQQSWTFSGDSIANITPGFQHFLMKVDNTYYCFHEYAVSGLWHIGLATSTDLGAINWTVTEPLLSPSFINKYPDSAGIADPTVLYIPWAPYKWHMWFDQLDGQAGVWTIGHAYTNDPTNWTKQTATGDTTAIVIDTSSLFGGYDNDDTHSPEAFLYGGIVHCLYAAEGDGHTNYDVMLAIANDVHGLGYSFDKWGVVTNDSTLASGDAERIQGVFVYNDMLYSLIYVSVDTSHWVMSYDGGKSWMELGQAPYGGSTKGFHSFLLEDNKVWGITHSDARLYYLDLANLTDTVLGVNTLNAKKVIPIMTRSKWGQFEKTEVTDGTDAVIIEPDKINPNFIFFEMYPADYTIATHSINNAANHTFYTHGFNGVMSTDNITIDSMRVVVLWGHADVYIDSINVRRGYARDGYDATIIWHTTAGDERGDTDTGWQGYTYMIDASFSFDWRIGIQLYIETSGAGGNVGIASLKFYGSY